MDWKTLAALNLIGSLVVPILVNLVNPLSLFDSFVLGALIFLISSGIEVLDLVKKVLAIRLEEHRTWIAEDQLDTLLDSIRSDFRNMRLHTDCDDKGFVQQLVRQRLERLRDEVHEAAESKELYVDNNHAVDTTRVTDLFREGKATYFLEVFRVSGDTEIFGLYEGPYFNQIYELSQSGHIKSIRALIVVDTTDSRACEKASQLLSFYESTLGYDARAISNAHFDELYRDFGLEFFEDFGIYGEVLLFRTVGYEPINRGRYSYDRLKIRKHKEFFDACWGQPIPPALPIVNPPWGINEILKL
jgi:hypothetical protein